MNGFQGKRILVTGATGLIGHHLTTRLMQEPGLSLVATGRSREKLARSFPDLLGKKGFEIAEHDAAQPLPDTLGPFDYIFHAAGPMERKIVENRPADVILPNILGTRHCLEQLRRQAEQDGKPGRLVVFSSVTVYGNNGTDGDRRVCEEDSRGADALETPGACYSESKRMSEVLARAYARQYGTDSVIARFSTVYGYTRNIPDTAFFEFIRKSMQGEDIVLNGSAFPRRDNIFIEDAVEALLAVALQGSCAEAYNISSNGEGGNFAAVDELAECIARAAAERTGKRPVKVVRKDDGAARKPGLLLDNTKMHGLCSLRITPLEEGIRKTLERLYP